MNKKIISFVIVGILAMALVSAVTYYAFFTASITVNQPIEISGDLEQNVDCEAGETCLGNAIMISNSGDNSRTVKIAQTSENEDIEVNYVGKLELTKKDTSSWEPLEDKVEITYTLVGDSFEFSGVPEGYELIYYKDGVVGLEGRIANPQPAIIVTSDIGNLAQSDDANLNADYSQAPDNYEHKTGAKLWAVPSDAINLDMTLDWSKMSEFYYESDLIYSFDNADNEITIPANSFIEFYPTYTPSVYIGGNVYELGFEIQ